MSLSVYSYSFSEFVFLYNRRMANEPDESFLHKALHVKRQAAMRRLSQAQAIKAQALREEQEAHRELAELEVAERVLRGLPSNDEEIAALSNAMSIRHVIRRGLSADPADAVIHGVSEETMASRQQKINVLRECYMMLKDGSWKSTDELNAGLIEKGLVLRVANPPQRISQILGADPNFRTQRGRGWSLNPDAGPMSPADAPGQRSRAIDLEDERLRQQARRVVDDEHRNARYSSKERPES